LTKRLQRLRKQARSTFGKGAVQRLLLFNGIAVKFLHPLVGAVIDSGGGRTFTGTGIGVRRSVYVCRAPLSQRYTVRIENAACKRNVAWPRIAAARRDDVNERTFFRVLQQATCRRVGSGHAVQAKSHDLCRAAGRVALADVHAVPERDKNLAMQRDVSARRRALMLASFACRSKVMRFVTRSR
jgi:hypothetical protein